MLLRRVFPYIAAAAGVVGCSCGEPSPGPAVVPVAGAGGVAGGRAGGAGRGGAPSGGAGLGAGDASGSGGAGGGGRGGGAAGACKSVPRPADVPASFEAVNALGCECTFWLGTQPEALPKMSWAPCAADALPGLGCERVEVAGLGEEWAQDGILRPDPTQGGGPLGAIIASRDFAYPGKTAIRLWWLRMSDLGVLAELDGDVTKGKCLPLVPRLAPGRLLANVDRSSDKPGGGFSGNSGFVTLEGTSAADLRYSASEPFVGGSIYTPTSEAVYGRLLDGQTAGMYRADGLKPLGTFLDTTPFGAAFPDNAIGKDFIIALEGAGYPGIALHNLSAGFQPLLPPRPDKDGGATNLGTDGKDLVWTDSHQRVGTFAFATNEVFTAPYTTSPAAIAKTQRRLTKADGGPSSIPWSVGCGYAAQRWEATVMLVRLSDGAVWRVTKDLVNGNFSPFAITCEHIYGHLDTGPLARIRIDKLGEPSLAE